MLRTVFGLALRQTEGLIGSIIGLLELDLAGPGLTIGCETSQVGHGRPLTRVRDQIGNDERAGYGTVNDRKRA